MKNRFFISLAATALMASFAACSNDTEEGVGGSSTVQFSATLVDNTATRAADDVQTSTLTQGLEIGLFSSGLTEDADNALLTVGSDNALTTKVDLTWKREGSADFYAYAPYDSELSNGATDLTFAVADDQTSSDGYIASDLLYASKKSVENGSKVNLAFKHQLAKVVVKITVAGENVTLKNPKVSLLNVDKAVKLTLASGELADATDKQNGNIDVHAFTSNVVKSSNAITCAAIVAPQTIETTNAFIRITTDDTSYDCSLSTQKTLESGKSYTFNVTFEDELVDVTYDENSSLEGWENDSDAADGTDTSVTENLTYTVGDYLLSDGSFVKKAKVKNADEVIGVIFSTEVSSTDKEAGYTAYILGFNSLVNAAPVANSATLSLGDSYTTLTSLKAEAEDLDGLSYTQYVQKKESTTSNFPLYDLSSLTALGESFSQWFIPSIGQFIQIMNNLGNAGIPTDNEANKYYSVIPNKDYSEATTVSFSGKTYLLAKTPTRTNLIATLKEATNNTSVIGANRYATASLITHNGSNETVMMDMSDNYSSGLQTDEKTDMWGISSGSSTNSRSRIACIAVKSDKIVAPVSE